MIRIPSRHYRKWDRTHIRSQTLIRAASTSSRNLQSSDEQRAIRHLRPINNCMLGLTCLLHELCSNCMPSLLDNTPNKVVGCIIQKRYPLHSHQSPSLTTVVVWRQIMAVSSGRDFDQSGAFYAFLVDFSDYVHPS